MKKNFTIHIGPHKTGSTYIQKTLYENRKKLKQMNIEYSECMKEGHIAHHDLAKQLYTKQYESANQILTNIKNTDNDILISSENFDRLIKEDIEFLSDKINEYNVKIIFFKRRLDDLLISSWQESIKHGGVESSSKYINKHIIKPFTSKVLNHGKIIDLYIDIFGKNNIYIIDFDNAQELGDDICDIIFEIINKKELKGIGLQSKVNKSMSYITIEIIRILNIIYIEKNKKTPLHFLRAQFISFEKNNSNNIYILELKKIIENNLELLTLNSTFIFNNININFNKKYKDIIINSNKELNNKELNNKTYKLPNDIWYINSKILKLVELLYIDIQKSNTLNSYK